MTSSTSRARRKREPPAPPGFHFDAQDAQRAVDFFAKRLRHVEGLWAGHPFILEPWQHDIVWNVFGWKREDGRRRYTTVYVIDPALQMALFGGPEWPRQMADVAGLISHVRVMSA